ncbi:MAG TPA: DUF5678 domain-containing protein [Blastocatellia bacterium]|nr:DUF5678 domain-containing protein [Blastocatellia bacterium]
MNTSVNYEDVRQQLLQLTDEERKRLLREMAESEAVKTNPQSQQRFSPQLRWLTEKANREMYGGQYVALRGGELVAHGTDSRQVIAAAKAAGLHPLFIAWVEPLSEETGTLIGWQ